MTDRRGRRDRARFRCCSRSPVRSPVPAGPTAPASPPGPESFAMEPRTPTGALERDRLPGRTGQGKTGRPYLERFTKAQLDEAWWRFARSTGSVPSSAWPTTGRPRSTHSPGRPLRDGRPTPRDGAGAVARPDGVDGVPTKSRITRSPGSARPVLTPCRSSRPGQRRISAARAILLVNMGRLDRSAVPALAGRGRELPTRSSRPTPPRPWAGSAIQRRPLPDLPASAARRTPAVREGARSRDRPADRPAVRGPAAHPGAGAHRRGLEFHRHQVEFPGDPVIVWAWDKDRKAPAPRQMKRGEAEGFWGDAGEAGGSACTARVSTPRRAGEPGAGKGHRSGRFQRFPGQDRPRSRHAVKAGARVLARGLAQGDRRRQGRPGRRRGHGSGQVTDPVRPPAAAVLILWSRRFAPGPRPSSPRPRLSWTWHRPSPFPGSSRVVPTLARFATAQSCPGRGHRQQPEPGQPGCRRLRDLGYETGLEQGRSGLSAPRQTPPTSSSSLVSHVPAQGTWELSTS